jgi:hypothetical protein
MTVRDRPTLTDAKGLGGIIAQDGFDYQVWDAIARIPSWLSNPAFEGLGMEVLEDFEARFFAPHAAGKHVLDRFQAKSGSLSRADMVGVFDSFSAFDAAHPGVARIQTLVTPALPAQMAWVARDPGRVRRARPFYSPFTDVCAASDNKLRRDLIDEFGADLGAFLAERVEVDLHFVEDRAGAEARFAAALHKAFPDLDVGPKKTSAAFAALNDLISQSRGSMIPRDRLVELLDRELGTALFSDSQLHIHLRSDRNTAAQSAIEIDGSAFSGSSGQFPPPSDWQAELVAPLEATAFWTRRQNHQRIALSGSYRLTTAMAIGWSFRSANGFEIDIGTKTGSWATDDLPGENFPKVPWQIEFPKRLVGDHLVVSLGVIRDPRLDVLNSLGLSEPDELLAAILATPIANSVEAQVAVQTIKMAIAQAVGQFNPKAIDLFIAGPAALAVALGHRWNALPVTQLHEFVVGERRYVPTAKLG